MGALIATAGGTGLAGSAGTIAVSYHDNSTKIGLPYNPALPQNEGPCTYSYGDPCRREIDDNSVDITNK